jgi:hypothetical protein
MRDLSDFFNLVASPQLRLNIDVMFPRRADHIGIPLISPPFLVPHQLYRALGQ